MADYNRKCPKCGKYKDHKTFLRVSGIYCCYDCSYIKYIKNNNNFTIPSRILRKYNLKVSDKIILVETKKGILIKKVE